MKKYPFKIISILLAICLILASCGSASTESFSSDSQSAAKSAESPVSSPSSTGAPEEPRESGGSDSASDDHSISRALEEIRKKYPTAIYSLTPLQAPDGERYRIELDISSPDSANAHKELKALLGESRYLVSWIDGSVPIIPLVPWRAELERPYHITSIFTYALDEIEEVILSEDAVISRVTAEISEEEIEELVEQEISRFMETHPAFEKTDKSIVEEGDSLEIAFKITDSSRVYYDVPRVPVKCGAVTLDEEIEGSVAGRRVGESYSIPYTGKGSVALALDDEQLPPLTCEIHILYIYEVRDAVLDDSYVKENTEYNSVKEWRDSIQEEFRQRNYQSAWKEIKKQLASAAEFKTDEEKLIETAGALALTVKLKAEQLGISEPEYIRAMGGAGQETTEDYIRLIYDQCRSELEEILLVRAIAGRLNLNVTEAELTEACQKDNRSVSSLSEAELNELEYYILYDKVLGHLISGE